MADDTRKGDTPRTGTEAAAPSAASPVRAVRDRRETRTLHNLQTIRDANDAAARAAEETGEEVPPLGRVNTNPPPQPDGARHAGRDSVQPQDSGLMNVAPRSGAAIDDAVFNKQGAAIQPASDDPAREGTSTLTFPVLCDRACGECMQCQLATSLRDHTRSARRMEDAARKVERETTRASGQLLRALEAAGGS